MSLTILLIHLDSFVLSNYLHSYFESNLISNYLQLILLRSQLIATLQSFCPQLVDNTYVQHYKR